MKFLLGRKENIVGKEKMLVTTIFPQCFQKASIFESLKVEIVW